VAASSQADFLTRAERGVAQARRSWRDNVQGLWNGKRNVRLRWYDERLGRRARYPLATIWGVVPLFESLAAVAIAHPTAANRRALQVFAEGDAPHPAAPPQARASRARHGAARSARSRSTGRAVYLGAESYWDPVVSGFAPYPGDRGPVNTWFDDNAWWGLAFLDAHRALGRTRYLRDAQTAFDFIVRRGWDPVSGGVWWNTAHTPGGQKSGEPLAGGALLGALLGRHYLAASRVERGRQAQSDLALARADLRASARFLAWGDAHFANDNGLYWRTGDDPTPTPYIAGPAVEAKRVLCQTLSQPAYCDQAAALANAAFQRFAYRLNMGPQFDVIYLHRMLDYGRATGDRRWSEMARRMAQMASANAHEPGSSLYLRAWDGSDMSGHQAAPGMLRTHAATVQLFGWLAAEGA
jgi:hypothetical protein